MTGNQLTEIEVQVKKLHFKYDLATIVGMYSFVWGVDFLVRGYNQMATVRNIFMII